MTTASDTPLVTIKLKDNPTPDDIKTLVRALEYYINMAAFGASFVMDHARDLAGYARSREFLDRGTHERLLKHFHDLYNVRAELMSDVCAGFKAAKDAYPDVWTGRGLPFTEYIDGEEVDLDRN